MKISEWFFNNKGKLLVWLIFGMIIYYFSANVIWLNDDLAYEHIYEGPRMDNYVPINGVGDLIKSNVIRYATENGRFVVHLFVQAICASECHWLFGLLNVLGYLLLAKMVMRVAGAKRPDWQQWLATICLILLFAPTQMTPSRSLNYPWLMAVTLWFVEMFFSSKDYRGWKLCLIGVFSIMVGDGHEGVTLAIGSAMVVYAIIKRFRLSLQQWVMASGYLAGFLIATFAPGTLRRLNFISSFFLLNLFYSVVVSGPLIIAALIAVWNKIKYGVAFSEFLRQNYFWLVAALVFYALNWNVGWFTPRQGLYIAYFGIIMIMLNVRNHRITWPWLTVLVMMTAGMLYWQYNRFRVSHDRYEALEQSYLQSADGMVFVDTPNYGYMREIDYSYTLYPPFPGFQYTDMYHAINHAYPGGKELIQYPAGTEELIRRDLDGNVAGYDFNKLISVEGDPRQHVVAIDKRRPATLYGKRKLLGLLREDSFGVDDCWQIYEGDYVDIYYVNDSWPLWVVNGLELH